MFHHNHSLEMLIISFTIREEGYCRVDYGEVVFFVVGGPKGRAPQGCRKSVVSFIYLSFVGSAT